MEFNYIAIEGNIGAGKTSLSKMLAAEFNSRLVLEEFEDNDFLPKFYQDPEKYAFPLELSFLAERYHQLKSIAGGPGLFHNNTISDYFLSKSLIFARVNLKDDEYKLFMNLYNIMYGTLPKPDILVYLYLRTERLKNNIKKRGRVYEQRIPVEYLERVNQGYLDYLRQQNSLPVLVFDVNDIDFVNNHNHFVLIREYLSQQKWENGTHYKIL